MTAREHRRFRELHLVTHLGDDQGRNRCGTVVIQEQQIFAAREVAKMDAPSRRLSATGGTAASSANISHTAAWR